MSEENIPAPGGGGTPPPTTDQTSTLAKGGEPSPPPSKAGGTGGEAPPPSPPPSVTIPDNWKDILSDDLKAEPSLGLIKDIQSLAKSYVHAQKNFGANKVVVPGENATDDDWAEFNRKIGVPQNETGYEIESNKEIMDEASLEGFKKIAAKAGLRNNQLQEIVKWYEENQKGLADDYVKKATEFYQAQDEVLKKEWGKGYDRKLSYAHTAAKSVGDEFYAWLEESKLANNANVIKALAHFGEQLFKEGDPKGETRVSSTPTPQEANAELNSMYGNSDHPIWKKDHPQHQDALKRAEFLRECVFGAE